MFKPKNPLKKAASKIKSTFRSIGPGIITGAADDEPSGIMTCLIVGAQSGLQLIWTTLLTIPLMIGIQEMCARIGMATKKGLAGNIKELFPSWLLYIVIFLMFFANTFNIAADLAGMTASLNLLIPLPRAFLAVFLSLLILLSLIFFSYDRLVSLFRWFTLPVLAYIASALFTNLSFREVISHALIPQFEINVVNLTGIVAMLGTTISPYLFFWQASEEVEEQRSQAGLKRIMVTKKEVKNMRSNVVVGMILSNIVMFFVLASSAGTLHQNNITHITNTAQAALALEPLAGSLASFLFTIGIIGTGILAIPVLAGSAAYAISEAFGWQEGLDKRFTEAKPFYIVITLSIILGLIFSILPFNPIDLLYATAIVYGILAPLLILIILRVANTRKIMKDKTNSFLSNAVNIFTFILMTVAALALFILS